jgi:uncharacterized repeat protein (TIGR03803 family)
MGGGARSQFGAIYELSPGLAGWTENVLWTFFKSIGAGVPLSIDPAGNLYSTTQFGGIGAGTVFEFSPNSNTKQIFSFNGTNGFTPYAGVIVDPRNGTVYGTTSQGGAGYGNVFRITAKGHATDLYDFCSLPSCADGDIPETGLLGKSGQLYGTTLYGGANNQGVIFQLTP